MGLHLRGRLPKEALGFFEGLADCFFKGISNTSGAKDPVIESDWRIKWAMLFAVIFFHSTNPTAKAQAATMALRRSSRSSFDQRGCRGQRSDQGRSGASHLTHFSPISLAQKYVVATMAPQMGWPNRAHRPVMAAAKPPCLR